jgi:CysZ protein
MRTLGLMPVFLAPLGSIGFVLARPRLLGLAILPTMINIAIFAGVYTLADWLLVSPVAAWEPTGIAAVDAVFSVVARLVLSVGALLLGALVFFALVIPLNAPFCDLISESVERELLRGRPELIAPSQPLGISIRHSIRDALRRVMFVAPIYAVLLVVGFVPLIGALVAGTVGFCLNGLFLALDGYSYPLDRRLMPFQKKWRLLSANRRIWVPLAAGLAMLLLIPCNILWLPLLSSTAATRVYCRHLLESRDEGGGMRDERQG